MDKGKHYSLGSGLVLLAAGFGACVGGGDGAVQTTAALTAQCAAPASIPSGAWTCPDARTLECGDVASATLYVPDTTPSCQGQDLTVSPKDPLGVGTHTISVSDPSGKNLCSAQLTVTDTKPAVLTSHTLNLWPPNHKFHEVAVSDCVSAVDACDGSLQGEFIWASSDEPIDSIGDGHFAPDIGLGRDTQHACVRSERQGPKDGRVYKLGVRVTDAAGNKVEGECLVIVDHDQRGVVGKDSGEAYRVQFDPSQAGLGCDGTPSQPGTGGTGTGSGGTGTGSGGTGTGSGGTGTGSGGSGGSTGDSGSGGSTAGSGGGEHII